MEECHHSFFVFLESTKEQYTTCFYKGHVDQTTSGSIILLYVVLNDT